MESFGLPHFKASRIKSKRAFFARPHSLAGCADEIAKQLKRIVMYTTQKQIRKAFWQHLKEENPKLYAKGKRSKSQNDQPTDVALWFIGFTEGLCQDGQITEKMAQKVTL